MTLLFKDEWSSGDWWVHGETKNTSFIEYAKLLKLMGVANHMWPLQLPDPRLRHIDPHDPNLTAEEQELVLLGCQRSLIYFVREVMRVPGSTFENPKRFQANRANMGLYWAYLNHISQMLVQPRQTGKSFSTDCLMTWLINYVYIKRKVMLLTKDDKLRATNLTRMKDLEAELPWYLRMRLPNDVGNTEELNISRLGNRYLGLVPANSPKDANNVARGHSVGTFQIDETAFFRYIWITVAAALAGGTQVRDELEAEGKPYGTIFTTTAGEIDEPEGEWSYNWIQGAAVWNEAYMDAANREELHRMVRANSRLERDALNPDGVLRLNMTFNHRQLGKSDEWLRRKIAESEAKGDAALRDFLNKWTRGNSMSPLTKEQLENVNNSVMSRVHVRQTPGYPYLVRWYHDPEAVHTYIENNGAVMALDPSDAVGRDDIGMHIRCNRTGDTLGAGNFNETNLIGFASWLCEILTLYPKLTLIVERRSSGAAILDYLILMLPVRGIDPFARLYNKTVQTLVPGTPIAKELSKPLSMRSSRIYDEYRQSFGFATSGGGLTSREDLFGNTLQRAVNVTGHAARDDMLVKQIAGLVMRDGRIDHKRGGHDDVCVAWLLSFWLLTEGRNLQYYGIRPTEIMTLNTVIRDANTPQKVAERARLERLIEEVRSITQKLSEEQNELIIIQLEARLKVLMPQLPNSASMAMSYEQLVHDLAEQRKVNRKTRQRQYQ